jgi:hypothetical protein
MPNWSDLNPAGPTFNAMRPRAIAPSATPAPLTRDQVASAVHKIIQVSVPPGKTAVITFEDAVEHTEYLGYSVEEGTYSDWMGLIADET